MVEALHPLYLYSFKENNLPVLVESLAGGKTKVGLVSCGALVLELRKDKEGISNSSREIDEKLKKRKSLKWHREIIIPC